MTYAEQSALHRALAEERKATPVILRVLRKPMNYPVHTAGLVLLGGLGIGALVVFKPWQRFR